MLESLAEIRKTRATISWELDRVILIILNNKLQNLIIICRAEFEFDGYLLQNGATADVWPKGNKGKGLSKVWSMLASSQKDPPKQTACKIMHFEAVV